ncbi:MAG: hypothetical protein AAF364_20120 [Pseudomonadota bacterium]
MNGENLPISESPVRDLGILVSNNLNFMPHIEKASAESCRKIGLFLRFFKVRDTDFLLRMYIAYIRPILEYATPVWSPSSIGGIKLAEKLQRLFTERISAVSHLNYPQRLAALGFASMEYRRIIFDLVELFKIVNELSVLKFEDYFQWKPRSFERRPNNKQIFLHTLNSNLARNFFRHRSAKIWNHLPQNIVDSPNAEIFKIRLRQIDLSEFLICFPDSYYE